MPGQDTCAHTRALTSHSQEISALTKQLKAQEAEAKRASLAARLEGAAQRRDQGQGPSGPTTPRSARGTPRAAALGAGVDASPAGGVDAAGDALGSAEASPGPNSAVFAGAAAGEVELEQDAAQQEGPEQQGEEGAGQEEEEEEGRLEAQVSALRRSASTRKLQAAWRSFARKQRTTTSLAQAFVDMGITSLPPSAAASAAAEGQGAEGVPAGSAAGGGRGGSGGGASAPVAILGAMSPSRGSHMRGLDGFEEFAAKMKSTATLKVCHWSWTLSRAASWAFLGFLLWHRRIAGVGCAQLSLRRLVGKQGCT